MKNYLCINGKKTALTQEQLKELGILPKQKVSVFSDGKIARIGKYEFIVLQKNESLGTVELLLNSSLKRMCFGENNNYQTSDVRKIVEDFGKTIEEMVGEENLLEHDVDLITLSGLKDFGVMKAKMSLLTFDKARNYIDILDKYKLDDYWWLATALSSEKHEIKFSVMCVSPLGGMFNISGDCIGGGVRPFCVLKSSIFES